MLALAEAVGFGADTAVQASMSNPRFYFCSYTMTSVGYGDLGPKNALERSVCTMMILTAGLCWAYVLGNSASKSPGGMGGRTTCATVMSSRDRGARKSAGTGASSRHFKAYISLQAENNVFFETVYFWKRMIGNHTLFMVFACYGNSKISGALMFYPHGHVYFDMTYGINTVMYIK